MNEKDRLYLGHIAECIERIEEYTAGGRDHFMDNHQAQDAVMRNFEIIGEAVKRLSDQVLERTQDIPWHQIAGFRDVLIHGYMRVDLKQVWNVIEQYLPNLKETVNYLLK
jgi:uncharacterized protein with HEPN domain